MGEMRLDDKIALITGAGGGLGGATASRLAAAGAHVIVHDINAEAAQSRVDAIVAAGGKADLVVADLLDDAQLEGLIPTVLERFGGVHVLVNNAGVVKFGLTENLTLADWDRVMNVNLRAVFALSHAAGLWMMDNGGGSIVNISSIAGHMANPQNIPYAVSKAAVRSLAQQIAVEWGDRGVRANAVSPGLTSWHMNDVTPNLEVKAKQAQLVPMKRVADPDEIADAVLFLASPASSFVNGQTLLVDGAYGASLMSQLPRPERLVPQ